jgi:hypothetical protein
LCCRHRVAVATTYFSDRLRSQCREFHALGVVAPEIAVTDHDRRDKSDKSDRVRQMALCGEGRQVVFYPGALGLLTIEEIYGAGATLNDISTV